MHPPPIRDDHDLLARALAVGWRITHVPGIGRRLTAPLALPKHLTSEAAFIAQHARGRLPALLQLLNADAAPSAADSASHARQTP